MSPILLAVAGASIFAALIAGGVASWWLTYTSPERRRIRTLAFTAGGAVAPAATPGLLQEGLDPVLARLSALAPKSAKDMGRLQKRLAKAGYPNQSAVIYYSAAQLLLPLAFGAGALIVAGWSAWPFALSMVALGYVIPGFWVSRQVTARQKAIQNGLADALDLLTVCVEAGSGLDQAIAKASEELELAHPAIAYELRLVITETRAGKPRIEAFQNFARRTGVDDVRSLVNMLTQTDRFGTSVSQALRGHAETIRTKRRQRAEERAGKVGVKLVFPLALCLFPALYIVCFGPVVVQIYRSFF